MTVRTTLRAAALAGSFLLPLAAQAEDDDFGLSDEPAAKKPGPVFYDSEVTAGARYQTRDSAHYGRYNGSPEKGPGVIGGFRTQSRDAWDSGGITYFEAWGENLDWKSGKFLPDASAAIRYGRQGEWGAQLFYEGIPYQQSDNFHTLMDSDGKLLNGLTPNRIPTTSATGAALVDRYNSAIDIGTRRDIAGGGVHVSPLPNWTFSSDVRHERIQGTRENSYTGANNIINYFPEPIDYDSDRFSATAAFTTRRLQADVSYIFSNFTDHLTSFNGGCPA